LNAKYRRRGLYACQLSFRFETIQVYFVLTLESALSLLRTTTTTTTGRTQLHKNKKLAKIAIEHLFSLDTTVDRPCLTEVARLLVAAGQKCKSMGYQWGELGDEMDDVWWLELLYDEDVQQRLKSIKELGENAATNRGGSVDELCGLIGDIELLTVNSPVGTMM
tara:strand:- start:3031 stop:3522 length:492 start_codon:yes stop_codon:yes gene_type:complete